ncbi:calpain-7 isoform X2 [Lepidochelys kempii]|uniref:calpain-7 isoform X2 n=1 Tax=Lepidochelys kempii TaxID=8472 RepID=UPI003C6F326F
MDAAALELDAVKFAQLAVQRDQGGRYQEAAFYYKEAAQALIYAGMAGSNLENIQEKINEYLERVQALYSAVQSQNTDPLKSKQQLDLERAHFLVTQAFDEDDKGNAEEAIELYSEAVELCLKTANETSDAILQSKLKQLARQALDRAEALKESTSKSSQKDKQTAAKPNQPVRMFFPLGPDFSLNDKPQTIRTVQASEPQGQRYTAEEIEVLRDKCGKLPLSPKQKAMFSKWVRPDDLTNNPTMIYTVSSFSIKQTIVSDCSFVASLAISAAYERRYNKKLITSIIYPQNKKGEPEYNPCGKYMVKLHINGVPRKVIIDDQLPVDHSGELLCSYSNNRSELWVSLIEKAYMKVMGGYDFPGSNSNIDLHALTGWIPERIAMHSDNQAFNKDSSFRMLYQRNAEHQHDGKGSQLGQSIKTSKHCTPDTKPHIFFSRFVTSRFHKGDVLITTATGVMSEEEGEKWGLVPTHAYAVLDIREYKGLRFLQLKNPWSHLRWKGRYSENDVKNWTPGLQKYLNFDPRTAQKIDNGIFWIAWEDLCQYYDVIYLSWNPSLFKESTCIHSTWDAKQGPVKDAYSLANNPQYRLEVQCPQGGAAVWVLLSRHITDKDDFARNREFITMVVYKTDGKKVYYPTDPAPYIDGIRINSPHYLTKIALTSPGSHTFTLVVSQYEKQNTIHYTLRVYSVCKFTFTKIPTPYTISRRVNGQWKGHSAGGCGNFRDSYKNNPIYQFQLEKTGPLLIELRGPRQYSVGFELVTVSTVGDPGPSGFQKKSSGDYRCGFCYMEVENVPAGVYNIIPSTFLPQQEGPFFLDFNSATPLKTSQLQ